MNRRLTGTALMTVVALILAGCASSMVLTRAERPSPPTPGATILLMEPDIQLFEMTAGGLLEARADWTAAATENVNAALVKIFEAKHATIAPYAAPSDPTLAHLHVQLTKLHERVGDTIIQTRLAGLRLPGKGDVFDWTLGEQAKALAEGSGAEYALFVRFLDSYASGGRVALMVVYALLGVGIEGGNQTGFASLVELKTGDLVWFNRLDNPSGDLRTPEHALDAIHALLSDFPF